MEASPGRRRCTAEFVLKQLDGATEISIRPAICESSIRQPFERQCRENAQHQRARAQQRTVKSSVRAATSCSGPQRGRPEQAASCAAKSLALIQTIARAGCGEPLREQCGVLAFAALAMTPARIVVAPAAHRVQSRHDVLRLERLVLLQPFAKQILEFVGQAQQHVTGRARARRGGGFQNFFQLRIGEHRNHRRDHDADGHARLAQSPDRPQARRRRCRARLERALEFVRQRRDADQRIHEVVACRAARAGRCRARSSRSW